MPARSALRRHADSEAPDLPHEPAPWPAVPALSPDDARPAKKGKGKKTHKAGRKKASGKGMSGGGTKATLAAHDARIASLEAAVADLGARVDTIARILDEAVKASVGSRPKATTVVPRNRPRKA